MMKQSLLDMYAVAAEQPNSITLLADGLYARTEIRYKLKEDAVKRAERNREWRHEYMTLLMRDQENIEKGMAMGIAQGREEGKREAALGFFR